MTHGSGGCRVVVCVAGLPGSGKGVVAEAAKSIGIPVYVMGDVVREEARRRGLEPTTENLVRLAKRLREEYGPEIIAVRTAEKIKASSVEGLVLVDGVRSPVELKVFEETIGRTIVVWVDASPHTRFERLRRRGRPDDPKTWEEFVTRDRAELEWGLGEVMVIADFILVNEDVSRREVIEKAKTILEVVRHGVRSCRSRG